MENTYIEIIGSGRDQKSTVSFDVLKSLTWVDSPRSVFYTFSSEKLEQALAFGAEVVYHEVDKETENEINLLAFKYVEVLDLPDGGFDTFLHTFEAIGGKVVRRTENINEYSTIQQAAESAQKLASIVVFIKVE